MYVYMNIYIYSTSLHLHVNFKLNFLNLPLRKCFNKFYCYTPTYFLLQIYYLGKSTKKQYMCLGIYMYDSHLMSI